MLKHLLQPQQHVLFSLFYSHLTEKMTKKASSSSVFGADVYCVPTRSIVHSTGNLPARTVHTSAHTHTRMGRLSGRAEASCSVSSSMWQLLDRRSAIRTGRRREKADGNGRERERERGDWWGGESGGVAVALAPFSGTIDRGWKQCDCEAKVLTRLYRWLVSSFLKPAVCYLWGRR